MITVHKTVSLPDTYPLRRLGPLEKLLFFDIETTGFSGDYSRLYLIGCTFFRDGNWQLIQWFADRPDAEEALLTAFFGFLKEFTVIVHFNGDGFDIPYLMKRCRAYGLEYDFSAVKSIDIYRRIKPYRRLLELDSLKQKSIERFLGVFREDPYSGGQLIEVYQDYLLSREDRLYDMLMLHNREDLEGMPLILPVLNYPDLLEHDFSLKSQTVRQNPDPSGEPQPILVLCAESDYAAVPRSVSANIRLGAHNCRAEIAQNRLTLEIGLYKGTLRHYYADYQNYYYLPFEDTAIHKSVGEFVEKSARKKATAQTCYTKKTGLFLPQEGDIWPETFKNGCRDKLSYAEYSEELFLDRKKLNLYLRNILNSNRA